MLTPESRPGDFLVGMRPNPPKKRLCHSGLHPASPKEPRFSRETESYRLRPKILLYQYVSWLCWQSAANCSPSPNSLITGKIQGISSILGPKPQQFHSADNSLAPKFPKRQNRET